MERTRTDQRSCAPSSGTPGVGRRCARFLIGLLVILLFSFGVIPALQRLGPVREVRDAVVNSGIDATALFYTESEVSGEAAVAIRNAIRYSVRPDRPAASVRPAAPPRGGLQQVE